MNVVNEGRKFLSNLREFRVYAGTQVVRLGKYISHGKRKSHLTGGVDLSDLPQSPDIWREDTEGDITKK